MTGHEHTDSLETQLLQLERRVRELATQVNAAYTERNTCVALLARMALAMGLRAGIGRPDDATDEWPEVVYIDLPTGQVSWHYHRDERHLFADLPAYGSEWDKHDTTEKYRRVRVAFANEPQALCTAPWAKPEPMTRFCPGCGSVGPIGPQYINCCPDGNEARVIPVRLAGLCRNLFQLALTAPTAES